LFLCGQVSNGTEQRLMMMMYRLLMLLVAANEVGGDFYHLIGAGATFPANVYIAWMAAYRSLRQPFVEVRLSYNARGSGFGKRAIVTRSVHYAGSDSLLSDAEYEQNPDLQMFPALAGSARLHHHRSVLNILDSLLASQIPAKGVVTIVCRIEIRKMAEC